MAERNSALHPQTILALDFLGAPLTAPFGAPMRLRIPPKLGYKNPKSIVAMGVTNVFPSGYWVRQGYNWFGGS
jgi:DMSO/TMAO reductase YedYZ molybdopterin-dependent catalytic subunit